MEFEVARRTPRYSFVVDVEVTDVQSEIQIHARTTTLGLSGCGVDTSTLFAKGASVRIRLSQRGAEVNANARVVYATPELGMGIVFTHVDREDERILESWIAEQMIIPIQKG